MRNARLAEWILSLVTDPARATSTVGDFIEESLSHGPLWFWATVSWTAVALLSRDLASNPWRMARLAVFGLLVECLLIVPIELSIGLITAAAKLAVFGLGGFDPLNPPLWGGLPPPLYGALGYAPLVLVQFQVGRVLAKRSPGHELAPCVALMLLTSAVGLVVSWLWGVTLGVQNPVFENAVGLLWFAPLAAGAIIVRRRRTIA